MRNFTMPNLEHLSITELDELLDRYEAQAEIITRGVMMLGDLLHFNSLNKLNSRNTEDLGSFIAFNMRQLYDLQCATSNITHKIRQSEGK